MGQFSMKICPQVDQFLMELNIAGSWLNDINENDVTSCNSNRKPAGFTPAIGIGVSYVFWGLP
jgi:hypothetical protein